MQKEGGTHIKQVEFHVLLEQTQAYLSQHYAAIFDEEHLPQMRPYIEQFLQDNQYSMENMTTGELVNRLYREMAEYSILTPYLGSPDLEEININAWDDVALTYRDGSVVKLREHFYSPQHAEDIVKRLLHHSGMIIDNAKPITEGYLPHNTRITAIKSPVTANISASLRLLHPLSTTLEDMVKQQTANQEMIDFLSMCIRYGVSMVIAGATTSGKTSALNALVQGLPDDKRIFSIETGARELSLVKRDAAGRVCNNVVSTLSKPSDLPAYTVTQEDLVVASLRFNPDLIIVGEMRDVECYSAVEASLTGHTVLSTVHAGDADAANLRIAMLCQKRFPVDLRLSMLQAGQAFPVVAFINTLENHERKIMDISECVVSKDGTFMYQTLYRYHITRNEIINGQYRIEGCFEKVHPISSSLQKRLIRYGAPQNTLEQFLKAGGM